MKILKEKVLRKIIGIIFLIFSFVIIQVSMIPKAAAVNSVNFINPIKSNTVETFTDTIINWFLGIAAFLIILFIIIGGIIYTTSAGNEERLNLGKKIVMYSVIGLILILISYSLVGEISRIFE